MPEALVPMVVGAGTVNPRAAPTSAAVGHESVAVPDPGVGVVPLAAGVGVALCAGPLEDGAEPPLEPPQAATPTASRDTAAAARVRR